MANNTKKAEITLTNVKEKASIFCVEIASLAKIEFDAKKIKAKNIKPISLKSKLIFFIYLKNSISLFFGSKLIFYYP